jgi:NADH:ubiquinone reductase (H+-translocating)
VGQGEPIAEAESREHMSSTVRPRVVVVGAGFAGLTVARELADAPVDVLLLDRNNFHVFWPLLYQIGTAALEATEIAYPVRSVFRKQPNVRFQMGEVRELYPARKVLVVEDRELHYDVLVLALGSAPFFMGIPGAEEHAYPLKTLDDGLELRNQILSRFELAVAEPEAVRRRELLTFVIVGAGATGVEFAGALAELIQSLLRKDYPELPRDAARVILLEALDKVLFEFPEELGAYARERLERMGVRVCLGAKVTEVEPTGVCLEDGTRIRTETVVWSAGVRGHPLAERWGLPTSPKGTVLVDPDLRVQNWPNLYAIGDLASFEQDGKPLPGIAPVANQQAEVAAANIVRQLRGEPLEHFVYEDPGRLAVIGRNKGVAEVRGRKFTGFPAWALWAGVHLFKVEGVRNKLQLTLNWLQDYLFAERAVRLVFPYHEVADVIEETPARTTRPVREAPELLRPGTTAKPRRAPSPRRRDRTEG